MKRIVLILLTAFSFSCAERELQLPVTTANDITEILDVSPIYMFYDEATDSIDFNRKNMISTTNWLVNIDKRLTLKQILPHLQYLQEKRRGDGMHKNENAKNYFTCFNENTKNLSFIEFTDVIYHIESTGDYIANVSGLSNSENIVAIGFKPNDDLSILNLNSKSIITKTNFNNLKNNFKEIDSIENIIYLNFHQDLSFQEYISYKSLFLELNLKHAKFSNQEFTHN
jgi:hypothetical protein